MAERRNGNRVYHGRISPTQSVHPMTMYSCLREVNDNNPQIGRSISPVLEAFLVYNVYINRGRT